MKKYLLTKALLSGLIAIVGLFAFWSCEKQEPSGLPLAVIAESPEMEAFVIAGYELQTALADFKKQMDAIDWATLPVVIDENGNEVSYLPIRGVGLNAKHKAMNAVTSVLQKRFPQVLTLSSGQSYAVLELCIERSATVSAYLLDKGINIFLPTKAKPGELPDIPLHALMDMADWMNKPDYKETIYLRFIDGHSMFYTDSLNTSSRAYLPATYEFGNKIFTGYPGVPIIMQIHTHDIDGGERPSNLDKASLRKDKREGVQNVDYGIYYEGTGEVRYYERAK